MKRTLALLVGNRLVGGQEFADSKVEQLWSTQRVDQNIARLEIAMDYEIAMGIIDGGADLEIQTHAVMNAQLLVLYVVRDPGPVNIFHDNVGQPRFRSAAVEQVRNIRMLQPRERLAFLAKTR